MKKRSIIIAAIVLIAVTFMFAVPFIFKGKIITKIKETANQKLTAQIDFQEVDLSLFRQFPNLSIRISNFEITGTEKFAGQKLASVNQFSAKANLSGLWNDSELVISEITLQDPTILLLSDSTGMVNWDIVKPTEPKQTEVASSSKTINIEKIEVINGKLAYIDSESPMKFSLSNANFLISGKMQGENSTLEFSGRADSLSYDWGNTNLVNQLSVSMQGGLKANIEKMQFTLLDNELLINKLPIKAEGSFAINPTDYDFDIAFKSPASSFGEWLGLIPPQYQSYLKDVQTNGQASLSGHVKGRYSEESLPAFTIDIDIKDGRLKYPSLPKEVEAIQLSASVSKPQGIADSTTLSIKQLSANIAGNPFTAQLYISTPVSDPLLKGQLNGRIDFESIKQAIPMDSVNMKGIIDARIAFGGRYSAIEKEQYDQFQTDGTISLSNFSFESNDFPQTLNVQSAVLKLSPKTIVMQSFTGKIGQSDFDAHGNLTQYWPYLMNRGTLNGNLKVNSNFLNLNEMTSSSSANTGDSIPQSAPFRVPANLNLQLDASAKRVLYEKLNITGVQGKVLVKEQKVLLDNLSMNLLNGRLTVSGSYATPGQETPDFDFRLAAKGLDLPTAASSISTIRHFIPVATGSTGAFGTELSLKGKIDNGYQPLFSTLNGIGSISALNVELIGSPAFREIAKYFRKEVFEKVKINDFTAKINIANGAVEIAPFTTRIAGQEVAISGKQSVNLDLDYRLDFKVNKGDLSQDVNKLAGLVPGTENIQQLPIGINIGGNAAKPDVKVDLTEAKKVVEAEFRKKAKSELQNAVKKLGLDKLIK